MFTCWSDGASVDAFVVYTISQQITTVDFIDFTPSKCFDFPPLGSTCKGRLASQKKKEKS